MAKGILQAEHTILDGECKATRKPKRLKSFTQVAVTRKFLM